MVELVALIESRGAVRILRDAEIDHPHLVQMHHVGSSSEYFYYTMELADPAEASSGPDTDQYRPTTLQSLIASEHRQSVDVAVEIVLSLLDGLACLHDAGIIHRDLKPSNVLKVHGYWKIADFGVATNDRAELTAVGTIGYLAPNGTSGTSTDLYAVGKILYCLITGNHVEKFPSVGGMLEDPIDRTRRAALLRIVNRACAHDALDRYEDARTFASDVRRAADVSRNQKRRLYTFLAATGAVVLLVALMLYHLTLPQPITVGDVISIETIPDASIEKAGGEPVSFLVTHDEVWSRSSGGNGHRYLALLRVQDVALWGYDEARAVAEQLGGNLVKIETEQENTWLFSQIVSDHRLWKIFVRRASDIYQSDPSAPSPTMGEAALRYLQQYRDSIGDSEEPDFVPMGAAHGPLFGARVADDGRSVVWADGSPLKYSAWDAFQPYFSQGDKVAFGFYNATGEVPLPVWARKPYHNHESIEHRPNFNISFIVEIPD